MDADPSLDNYERYDVLVGHDPSGTSVQNMAHWKQMLDKKKFIAYEKTIFAIGMTMTHNG